MIIKKASNLHHAQIDPESILYIVGVFLYIFYKIEKILDMNNVIQSQMGNGQVNNK